MAQKISSQSFYVWKHNYWILSTISLLYIVTTCNFKNDNNSKIAKCDTALNLDTSIFKRFIIFDNRGNFNSGYEFITKDVERAGLKRLDKGYDSIALRLFYQYREPITEIVEIRRNCEGWVAQFFTIKRHIKNSDTIVNVVSNLIKENPRTGWNTFTKKIFSLGVTTLPDWSDISNYNPSNDGESVDVEISTKDYYRLYTYLGPKTKRNIAEAKALEEIMALIEYEFGVKRLRQI